MIRTAARWLLAASYAVAGWFHVTSPDPFLRIMPGWVPEPEAVVLLTGLAEFAGALALAQPWSLPLRKAGATGLAAYALCVWPANINHMLLDLATPRRRLGPRLPHSAHDRATADHLAGAVGWRGDRLAAAT